MVACVSACRRSRQPQSTNELWVKGARSLLSRATLLPPSPRSSADDGSSGFSTPDDPALRYSGKCQLLWRNDVANLIIFNDNASCFILVNMEWKNKNGTFLLFFEIIIIICNDFTCDEVFFRNFVLKIGGLSTVADMACYSNGKLFAVDVFM